MYPKLRSDSNLISKSKLIGKLFIEKDYKAFARISNSMDSVNFINSLPHRYPFLFVDKVVEIREDEIIVQKNVSINEWFFEGHFPGKPVLPGVIIIEAVAQAAGILFLSSFEERDKYLALLLGIENFKFKRMVEPGDVLTIRVKKIKTKKIGQDYFPFAYGEVYVGQELVASGNLNFALKKK